MENFNFISNTKIYFGKNRINELDIILHNYKFKNIALLYGKNSIKKSGLYDRIINKLGSFNVYEVSGIEANPKLSLIIKAREELKDKNIDCLLAVGGGSVLDTAKNLSHSMYYDGNPFDFNTKKATTDKVIPVISILTIAAAGSELSDSCVISNDLVNPYVKLGFNADSNRPLATIMDPTLTYSVSKFQTGCGIVDMMMHTLERFLNPNDDCMLADNIAIGLLKTVLHYGKIVIDNPNDYEARANLMLASSLSHNGLTGLGKKTFMRVHGIEHILSGCYDNIAHGEGLSVLFPAWCLYISDDMKANAKLAKLGKELFGKEDAIYFINKLKEYFKDIGMPTKLADFKTDLDIKKMALLYSDNKKKTLKDFKDLDYDAFIKIFEEAK